MSEYENENMHEESCSGDCDGCSSCSDCGGSCGGGEPADLHVPPHAMSNINKVIGVVSGKGGVGKSMVTSMLSVLMHRKGYKVAVMDADMTGPSIPKAFGVHGRASANEFGILPNVTEKGIALTSVNLFLDDETDPVIWRGIVIGNTVKQFWTDVVWGDVDYMFIDMPPGTGDVPLTIFQSVQVDGIIIVTSPQELVSMIVEKAVNMAEMMDVPILGLVENMSYFECPNCNEKHSIYGESHIDEIAKEHELKVLARLPMRPEIAKACDAGKVEDAEFPELELVADFLETV